MKKILTENERVIHKQAVKLRKLSDVELVTIAGVGHAPERIKKTACSDNIGVEKFIEHLDTVSGTGNSIGHATVTKLKKIYALFRKGGAA